VRRQLTSRYANPCIVIIRRGAKKLILVLRLSIPADNLYLGRNV